jgi:hypothetical protein
MLLLLPAAIKRARNPGEGFSLPRSSAMHLTVASCVLLDGSSCSIAATRSAVSLLRGPHATGSRGREGRVPLQERAWAPRPLAVKGRPHLPRRERPRAATFPTLSSWGPFATPCPSRRIFLRMWAPSLASDWQHSPQATHWSGKEGEVVEGGGAGERDTTRLINS